MNNTCGFAPIYFSGAILFLAGGGTLIYYDHTIIGATVMVPGLILLGLMFFTLVMLSRIKRGDDDVKIIIRDPELLKELKNRQQTRVPHQKHKRKNRKK
jgi:hypothetical protein